MIVLTYGPPFFFFFRVQCCFPRFLGHPILCVMAPGRAPPLAPVAYRSVLLLWLLSGLVGGFLVGAPRISQPRSKHAARSSGGADQAASRGASVTTVLPRRARCNAVTASPAAANDVAPEDQVRLLPLCTPEPVESST